MCLHAKIRQTFCSYAQTQILFSCKQLFCSHVYSKDIRKHSCAHTAATGVGFVYVITHTLLIMLKMGTPKPIDFLFGINRKLMVLGVPILKHFWIPKILL